ncbi:S8 family serine peptidase [Metabacillus sp. KIGAM252]|uniref:S8 family serine peptidase n=1 Tax=Metabacillus flavus TaxID=2823519 RepID=A0ABS5LJA8_9BACI|nr:S8 family peptidase [Metabacillus flavus]MBS2970724.1 S8 family serine peptidase [Metabacillus flavus]
MKFIKLFIAGAALILAIAFCPAKETFAAENKTDRVIVKFKNAEAKVNFKDYPVEDSYLGTSLIITVKVPEGLTARDVIASLQARPDVEFAEADHQLEAEKNPSDPFYYTQWHHYAIHAPKAWDRSLGNGVLVAVIDGGMDVYHKDLRGNLAGTYNAVTNNSHISADDHGTHVAGIIAASMDNDVGGTGIAPNASILAIDCFSGDGAYSSDAVEAIYYAVSHGAKIINMSLGGSNYSLSYNEAIQYAYRNGVLVVAAAGNESTSAPTYPASYPNVISVSSTTSYNTLSSFSNYGTTIDIAAPGSLIYSTLPGNDFGKMSGTSMAAPVVSGAAALIWSADPSLTNEQVARRLYETADDLGSSGKDLYFGYGLVNVEEALNAMKIELPVPFVNEVNDHNFEVSGSVAKACDDCKAVVLKNGQVLASGYLNSQGQFKIPIASQQANTVLEVKITDSRGNESKAVSITVVDRTPPDKPVVFEVNDQQLQVAGTAEPNAAIEVKIDGDILYNGKVKANGYFTASLPKYSAGTTVQVTVIDEAGNRSETVNSAIMDRTPPAKPSVSPISDTSKTISGKGEPGVYVGILSNNKFVFGTYIPRSGSFSFAINPYKAGTALTIVSMDESYNLSGAVKLTVQDKTPPRLTVNQATYKAKAITGKTEPGAIIQLKTRNRIIGKGKVDSKGNYIIPIKPQKKGTSFTIKAADSAGNYRTAEIKIK